MYGITFVDNQSKVVFNGSDLGKGYSAAALQSRLAIGNEKPLIQDEAKSGGSGGAMKNETGMHKQQDKTINLTAKTDSPLDVLLSTKEQYDNTPYSLLKKKRKKKKPNL